MPRKKREIIVDGALHVTVRGVYGFKLFRNDTDKIVYLLRFAERAIQFDVKIHDFCVMNTHAHFLVRPTTENGLAKLMQCVQTYYGGYRNRTDESGQRGGAVFAERYFSVPIKSARHFIAASRYIQRNAVGVIDGVKKAEDYLFSSARLRLGLKCPVAVPLTTQLMREIQFSDERLRTLLEDEPDHYVPVGGLRPRYPFDSSLDEPFTEWWC